MKITEQMIIEFVDNFYKLYFIGEYDKLAHMMSDKIQVGGIYVNEIIVGKKHVLDFWKIAIESNRNNTVTTKLHTKLKEVINDEEWVAKSVFKIENKVNPSQELFYFASECKLFRKQEVLEVGAISFSLIDEQQIEVQKDYFKDFMLEKENAFRNNDDLLNSVPGGIFKCLYNEELTLTEMSEGFLRMVGYTREEMETFFNNSLRSLILEEDFEPTLEDVKRQLKVGINKRIEYRIRHKDGSIIWLLDKGTFVNNEQGVGCFHCIVIDITQEKEIREQYETMLLRTQIIMNQTNDVVFEWDIKKDRLFVSNNWEKNFGKQKWADGSSLIEILKNQSDSPFFIEDIPIITKAIQKILQGESYVELETRILHKTNVYIWCKIRVTVQFDKFNKSNKAIGVVINIDQEKKRSLLLQKKASQDSLTGLNNKISTQEMIINEIMYNKEQGGALLIIDVDDFKCVNDTRGHLFGDAVLSDIANKIRETCRVSDIIGRIGGDEFMVFLKNIYHMEDVEEKAQAIINEIRHLQSLEGLPKNVSCSIGISLCPEHAKDFNSLYKFADYALYQAKTQGKNCFAIYNEKNIQEYLKQQLKPYSSSVNADIESNDADGVSGEIAQYVFGILYESENIQRAIEDIIEIVGKKYNVSRVYIFENSSDDNYCVNTFEWCNDGVEPQKEMLQNISYKIDLGDNYLSNFNEDGIFYCPDISLLNKEQYNVLAPQGIKSLLQCAIRDNGKFRGFVGFDECNENRYWTQEQINALSLVAETLSIFLLKSRKEEMYEEENEALLKILDDQDAFIYIVEEESYELLYANKKTKDIAQSNCVGNCCYRLFMGRETHCEICPAKKATRIEPSGSIEFFNKNLGVWTDAYASYIKWRGKDARLVVCHDISRFKK